MTLPLLILAVLTLAGAVAAMTMRNLVHCILALILSFAGIAAIFIELDAEFVGLSQILVYVGAVAILLVFAILLTPMEERASHPARSLNRLGSSIAGILVTAAVFAILIWAVVAGNITHSPMAPQVTIKQIGDALLQRFVLPLELIGLMLTAALIGAIVLAMQERPSSK